jgi:IclR family KDG regulon transcriptional repressor
MAYESREVPVNAVYKAFAILEMLGEGAASLTDISRRIGMPKSSASRFLASLVDLGAVSKADDGEFSLTAKLFSLGAQSLKALDLVPAALPFMRALRSKTSETVHLAVQSKLSAVYLHKVDSPHSLRMHSRIGYQAPLYCTALGKCLLAWLDEDRREALIREMKFVKTMPNTLDNADALRAHLALVREQGYACDNEENEENVICFGAPVFDWAAQVIAATSVSMPIFRFRKYDQGSLLAALKEAAQGISAAYGYQDKGGASSGTVRRTLLAI